MHHKKGPSANVMQYKSKPFRVVKSSHQQCGVLCQIYR